MSKSQTGHDAPAEDAQAYWESAALMAAVELEIFTAIATATHDPGSSQGSGISERNASAC